MTSFLNGYLKQLENKTKSQIKKEKSDLRKLELKRKIKPRNVRIIKEKKKSMEKVVNNKTTKRIQRRRDMPYREYLKTAYWKSVARIVRRAAGYKCELCESNNKLQVHHESYMNLGNEKKHLEDLVCLCGGCHQGIYKKRLLKDRDQILWL